MRFVPIILGLVLVLLPPGAQAQRMPVVVELFTSQGCSSCPPADALLAELATGEGVLALSLPVDYWDYLGWKDSFGQASHTARQKGYAKRAQARSLFTPQAIVQGQDMLIGHHGKKIRASIAAHQARPVLVSLALDRVAAGLRIRLAPLGPGLGPAVIYLIAFQPQATVAVEAGENAGRRLDYVNVVTRWAQVAQWDGRGEADLTVPHPAADPAAVIVQRPHQGPILSAAVLR